MRHDSSITESRKNGFAVLRHLLFITVVSAWFPSQHCSISLWWAFSVDFISFKLKSLPLFGGFWFEYRANNFILRDLLRDTFTERHGESLELFVLCKISRFCCISKYRRNRSLIWKNTVTRRDVGKLRNKIRVLLTRSWVNLWFFASLVRML